MLNETTHSKCCIPARNPGFESQTLRQISRGCRRQPLDIWAEFGGIRSRAPSARWAHQTVLGRLLSKGAEAQLGVQAEDASFAKGIPDSRRRGLHIARDSFFKSYLSLVSSLLLSAKDHACSTCSLASALTTASRRYHSFAVFPLFIAV